LNLEFNTEYRTLSVKNYFQLGESTWS